VVVIASVNWQGLRTLYLKEVRRFFKVQLQTVWAPAITTLLFLVIFALALGRSRNEVLGVPFADFLAPGLIVTPLTESALTPSALDWMRLHTPNGQVPGSEACAGTALFLLSDEAEHVHGQTVLVDGGMSVWQQPNPPH
jgi:hypothetical protein